MSEIVAAAWVCIRQRRVLVVRATGSDAFYLPGGKIEPGETYAEAAAREVGEEVGILVDPAHLTLFSEIVAPAHNRPPGTVVRLICFTGGNARINNRVDGTAAGGVASPPVAGVNGTTEGGSGAEPVPANEIAELDWFSTTQAGRAAPAIQLLIAELAAAGLID